jgi:hypothetical protein
MEQFKKAEVEFFYNGLGGTTSCMARDAHTHITVGEEESLSLDEVIELADRQLPDREREIEAMRIVRNRFLQKWNAVLYLPKKQTYKVMFLEIKNTRERVEIVEAQSLDEAKELAAIHINAHPRFRLLWARLLEEGETI